MNRKILSIHALEAFVKSIIVIFALWTVCHQIVLAARWPVYLSMVLFGLALAGLGIFRLKMMKTRPQPPCDDTPSGVIAGVLVLALLSSCFSLIISRPDWDDVDFFHRPLIQSRNLRLPMILTDTTLNVEDIPGPTTIHLIPSYEMLVAYASRLLHLDGLLLYQNGTIALTAFLMPVAYFLLFRRFGLQGFWALVAAAGSVTFLWFDGNLHPSLGNLAFVRLWQGKCILLTLLCPLISLLVLEFWRNPGPARWLLVFLSGITAVGLSATGLFIMPVLVLALSIALAAGDWLDNRKDAKKLLTKVAAVNAASMYCVLMALGLLSGVIPELRPFRNAPEAIGRSLQMSWWGNLTLTTGKGASVAWYAAILFVGPWLWPEWKKARVPILWSLAVIAICFNPLTGPLWLKAVLAAYYRLAFVLPVAFSAGLAAAGAAYLVKLSSLTNAFSRAKLGGLLLLAVLFHAHFRQATFYPSNRVSIKTPLEYRVAPNILAFSRAVVPALEGRNLLAPQEFALVLPLMNLSLRLETQRWWVTQALFRDAGKLDEGWRRVQAQKMVTDKSAYQEPMLDVDLIESQVKEKIDPEKAFVLSVQSGVDAVIVRNVALQSIEDLLATTGTNWQKSHADESFTLLLKQ